jgi:hypothetical protein
MRYTPADLAATLALSAESDFVRVVGDWLARGSVAGPAPDATGDRVCDALVAAAVAHLASTRGEPVPAWTREPSRILDSFWHPGRDAFFAYALAHAPAQFAIRGLLVERDSLVSV